MLSVRMARRLVSTGFALIAAALAAAPVTAFARPHASVRVASCEDGAGGASREAAFTGEMRSLARAQRMAMRFELLERRGDGPFRRVEADGLGVWRSSKPDVSRFVFTQRVTRLRPDADYRVAVAYRWLDAHGDVVDATRRRSPICARSDALPNLRVSRIAVRPGEGGGALYLVTVRNDGGAAAPRALVRVAVDGAVLPAQPLAALGALESRTVAFSGPACSGSVSATADAADDVPESSEADNVRTVACPAG
jgi:hypothetical protein